MIKDRRIPHWRRLTIAVIAVMVGAGICHATAFDNESAWLPEVEQLFVADKYPSPRAAARALARSLAGELRDATPAIEGEQERPLELSIAVTGAFPERHDGIRWSWREAFQEASTKAVRFRQDASRGDLQVHLAVESRPESSGPSDGRMQMSCGLPAGDFLRSATFVDKPWVEMDEAASGGNGQSGVCVRGAAEHDGSEVSPDVIRRAVTQELARRVIKQSLRGKCRNRFPLPTNRMWVDRWLHDQLTRRLKDSSLITDRFRQTFYTTLEDSDHVALAREAVLLDVSDRAIHQLGKDLSREFRHAQHRRRIGMLLGGLGAAMSFVVGLIGYNVLNIVSKGYYVWQLRLATAAFLTLMAVAAGKVAMMLAH